MQTSFGARFLVLAGAILGGCATTPVEVVARPDREGVATRTCAQAIGSLQRLRARASEQSAGYRFEAVRLSVSGLTYASRSGTISRAGTVAWRDIDDAEVVQRCWRNTQLGRAVGIRWPGSTGQDHAYPGFAVRLHSRRGRTHVVAGFEEREDALALAEALLVVARGAAGLSAEEIAGLVRDAAPEAPADVAASAPETTTPIDDAPSPDGLLGKLLAPPAGQSPTVVVLAPQARGRVAVGDRVMLARWDTGQVVAVLAVLEVRGDQVVLQADEQARLTPGLAAWRAD